MKKILVLSIILLTFGCTSTKNMKIAVKKSHYEIVKSKDNTYNISEKWQIVPNASIKYTTDKFGGGYVQLGKGNKTVFFYKLSKNPADKTIMDGGYVQEIFFEITGDIKDLSLENSTLSQVNLLIGKHGFFRGSGVYPVKTGSLQLKVLGNNKVDITINIEKPGQMVQKKQIHKIIELNQDTDE